MIDTYELRFNTYDEGWAACRNGVAQVDNPYVTQRDQEMWWDEGWEACYRENIGPLPGEVGHQSDEDDDDPAELYDVQEGE
jgi:hypothetical protein